MKVGLADRRRKRCCNRPDRRERGLVDALWTQGRGQVLSKFLARPKIFECDVLAFAFEQPARENLKRALEALQRP